MKRRREVGVGRVMIQCTELHYIPQYHTVVHRMTLNQTMHSKDMVYGCGEHKERQEGVGSPICEERRVESLILL